MLFRANVVKISRASRKCSNFVSFLTIFAVLIIFCCLMIIVSEKSTFGISSTTEDPEIYSRLADLSTWNRNQSTNVTSYLDLHSLDTFTIQPTDSIRQFNESSSFCDPSTKILIIATSKPADLQARVAIRQTWGSKEDLAKRHAKVLFILGLSGNETIENLVEREANKFGDIIQESFLDTYHNLTLKSIALLKWVNLTCSHDNQTNFIPKYIVKTDDDVFINIDRLIQILLEKPTAKMIGRLTCGAVPISDTKSKLYMPKYLYPGKMYPGYLSGTGYVIKGEIIPELLKNSLLTPLIHLEDIYVTALLARENNIFPDDSVYFTYDRNEPKSICAFKNLVTSHRVRPQEMRFIWAHVRRPYNCSTNPKKQKYLRKAPVKLSRRLKKLCMFIS